MMKLKLIVLLMLCSSVIYGYEIGVGSGTSFPVSTDTANVLLTNNDKATAGYANDVKKCIAAIERFLLAEPWFMYSNVGIGTSNPVQKFQVVGTNYTVGASSVSGNANFGGTLTMNAGNINLGGNTLTTTNTTKISNLNADKIDGYHIYVSSNIAILAPVSSNFTSGIFPTGLSTVTNVVGSVSSSLAGSDYDVYWIINGTGIQVQFVKVSGNFSAANIYVYFVAYGN